MARMSERPFLMGSETEFGISGLDPGEQNHITNSLRLVGLCPDLPAPECIWDYRGENPLLDLYGRRLEGEREDPDLYSNRALNKPLPNGGRLYVDGAHPEYSTPEVTDPLDLVRYESAGERIADRCRQVAERITPGRGFALYKNNSDGKGNSYGYHENYLVPRRVPVDALVNGLLPFLVTRQLFCGAGKVGAEHDRPKVAFQISQRADFFENLVDINTMVRRPLFNTRDEPHANREEWLRLHVIPADANMSQVSTFVKVGTMALVLRLIEDDALGDIPKLADPVTAFWKISRDLSLKQPVPLADGGEITALEIQRIYLQRVKAYGDSHRLPGSFPKVVDRWETLLDSLSADPLGPDREVDWVIKYRMIDNYLTHRGLDWGSAKAKAMDIQYHNLDPQKGLFFTLRSRGLVEELVGSEQIDQAVQSPPEDTRAWFRGQCLARFGKAVYGVSWSSVMLEVDGEVRRIPTDNPHRGTRQITEPLFEQCATPGELVALLEGA